MTDRKGASAPGFQNPIERLDDLLIKQANDWDIWFASESASEAYIQREIRKLHDAAESVVAAYKTWKRESGDG